MVEAYALSIAVEHGLRTRATIVDMRGQLNVCQWEETASAAMGHVWFADCECLFARKQVDNKRLAIDFSALKQLFWNNCDDCDEEVVGSKGDYPPLTRSRCCQIADKDNDFLLVERNVEYRYFRPTDESLAIKTQNRKWRASKKEHERLQDPDN